MKASQVTAAASGDNFPFNWESSKQIPPTDHTRQSSLALLAKEPGEDRMSVQ